MRTAKLSNKRLDTYELNMQIGRVFHVMKDSKWRTLKQISTLTKDPEPSVSARLRDLRKRKFGSFLVQRRKSDNFKLGVFEYSLSA